MTPLVSILIPAFNAQEWIADAIRSGQTQTWPNKEIIVVDDGSRDRTAAIAEGLSVTVIRQTNSGAAAARNNAFAHARGDYIQWLDADDLLAPDKIASQMRAADSLHDPQVLLAGAWGGFSYRTSHARFDETALWADLTPLEWLLRKWETNSHMQTATWLVSRELTQTAGPWDTRLTMDDDGEYFFRVIRASKHIRFVREAKVFYRITTSARLSHIGRSERKMESQFLSMKLQIDALLRMVKNERARAAVLNYLRTWLPIFYPERLDLVAQLQEMAAGLGGRLELPRSGWKYAWIECCFGPWASKQVQLEYNRCKSSVFRMWDKVLYWCQSPSRKLEAGS